MEIQSHRAQAIELPLDAMRVILAAVDSLAWPVGRVKLSRLLKGDLPQPMALPAYLESPFLGALSDYSVQEIDGFIREMVKVRFLLATRGARPFLRPSLAGLWALRDAGAKPKF